MHDYFTDMVSLPDEIKSELMNFSQRVPLQLGVLFFIVFFLDEIIIPIPYLIETLWIIVGFQMYTGNIHISHFLILWFIALTARLVSNFSIYHSREFYDHLYHKVIRITRKTRFIKRIIPKPFHSKAKIKLQTAIMTRFIGFRLPMTIALAVRNQYKTLLLATLITSIMWDGAFTAIGYFTSITNTGFLLTIGVGIALTVAVHVLNKIIYG